MGRNTTASGNMRGNDSRSILDGGESLWRKARTNQLISSIETVFFRIDIESISGLRAIYEAEEAAPR